jgi:preprotein translocase subunit SecD
MSTYREHEGRVGWSRARWLILGAVLVAIVVAVVLVLLYSGGGSSGGGGGY